MPCQHHPPRTQVTRSAGPCAERGQTRRTGVVGGPGSVIGTLLAALLLGVADIAGKYYVPEIGAFVIYAAMIVLLLLFPHGLLGRRKAK